MRMRTKLSCIISLHIPGKAKYLIIVTVQLRLQSVNLLHIYYIETFICLKNHQYQILNLWQVVLFIVIHSSNFMQYTRVHMGTYNPTGNKIVLKDNKRLKEHLPGSIVAWWLQRQQYQTKLHLVMVLALSCQPQLLHHLLPPKYNDLNKISYLYFDSAAFNFKYNNQSLKILI